LLDKSRKSKIEVRKLREQRQFDGDIASEIARMTEYVQSSKYQNSLISLSSALDIQNSEPFNDIGSFEAMCSLVLDLRHSVSKDQSLHYDLILEDEDLLAILTHLDIERSKLLGRLWRLGENKLYIMATNDTECKLTPSS
jgi:hypothetical protein